MLINANAAWNVLNFRRPVVEALIADGHGVTVLAPEDHASPRLMDMGCDVQMLRMSVKGLNPIEDYRLVWRLRRAFTEHRADVVLSFTIKNNIYGAMAAERLGVPFIPNVTGLGTAFLSGGLLQSVAEALYRRAFRKLPLVFFQNGDDRNLFLRRGLVDEGQARLLPGSGIDLERFAPSDLPPPEEPVTFLMIARLLRDKGVHEFVEAARRLKSSHPEARFQLLGPLCSGNRSAIDEAAVRAWVAEGVIEYLGEVEDVRPHIRATTCVVLPSYREGAPRSLIEAAAMARPLIATDVPGCRTVVDAGVSGFLCAPRSAESLAASMVRFLEMSHEQRQQMGQAGREKMAREFDQARVVAAYRSAIVEVLVTKDLQA